MPRDTAEAVRQARPSAAVAASAYVVSDDIGAGVGAMHYQDDVCDNIKGGVWRAYVMKRDGAARPVPNSRLEGMQSHRLGHHLQTWPRRFRPSTLEKAEPSNAGEAEEAEVATDFASSG